MKDITHEIIEFVTAMRAQGIRVTGLTVDPPLIIDQRQLNSIYGVEITQKEEP